MSFNLYVNGNLVHDEGAHDAEGRVTRAGGGPLTFATKAEGDAFADALYRRTVDAFVGRGRAFAPKRESFVVAEEPPAVAG
jgi:hypothetical protein